MGDAHHHVDQLFGAEAVLALLPHVARREALALIGEPRAIDQIAVARLAVRHACAVRDDAELGASGQRERPNSYSAHAFQYESNASRKRLLRCCRGAATYTHVLRGSLRLQDPPCWAEHPP